MKLTSVVLTSWISSITSKISWIVGWPWSNHVCVCVWVCVLCLSVYNLIHGPQKQIRVVGFFLSGNLDYGLEKSWKNHGTFFWDFCGNPNIILWVDWTWTSRFKVERNAIINWMILFQNHNYGGPSSSRRWGMVQRFHHWSRRFRYSFTVEKQCKLILIMQKYCQPFWCQNHNISWQLGQYRCCWCPGSLHWQVISNHGIDYVGS